MTNVIHVFRDIFASSIAFNFFSFLIALLGIIFTIYFYYKSKKVKKPLYAIRTVNLIRENITKIETVEITYSGQKIDNLSISKIAFWNDGKETINNTDVATNNPVAICIGSEFEILDAKILWQKNDANDFTINLSEDKKNLTVKFDYFDFEEGIILQISHTGNSSTDFSINGAIKGVKGISRKSHSEALIFPFSLVKKITSGFLFRGSLSSRRLYMGALFLISGILLTLVPFFSTEGNIEKANPNILGRFLPFSLIGIPYFWMGIVIIKRRIPRGFNVFEEEF